MDATKLKPCPFCGNGGALKNNHWYTWVECSSHCGVEYVGQVCKRKYSALTAGQVAEEAIKIWNTRHEPDTGGNHV